MKKFILIILSITFFGCKTQTRDTQHNEESDKNLSIVSEEIYEFSLSSLDTGNVFGIPLESEFEIGPTSPIVIGEDIYLLDVLFNKVKKITKNGNLKSSVELTNDIKIQWLNSIVYANNKIYVLSDYNYIYVLDKELNLIKSILIPNYSNQGYIQNKYFISNDKPIYYDVPSDDIYIVNENSVKKIDFNINLNTVMYLGFEYDIDSTQKIFKTDLGVLKLNEPIQDITLDYYQCINFAFNDSIFVHFSISPDRKKITFYKYKYE